MQHWSRCRMAAREPVLTSQQYQTAGVGNCLLNSFSWHPWRQRNGKWGKQGLRVLARTRENKEQDHTKTVPLVPCPWAEQQGLLRSGEKQSCKRQKTYELLSFWSYDRQFWEQLHFFPSLKTEVKTKALFFSFFFSFLTRGIICCEREEDYLFRAPTKESLRILKKKV